MGNNDTPRKRVLMMTYYWPPSGGSGVQRCLKFAKYFREFGWEPIVFTAENPTYPKIDHSLEKDIPANIEIIKCPIWEPYEVYKKFTGRNKDANVVTHTVEDKKVGLMEKLSRFIRGNFFIPDARAFWIKPATKFLLDWLQENPVDVLLSSGPPHSVNRIGLHVHQATGLPWVSDWRDPWTDIDYFTELYLTKWGLAKHLRWQKEVLETANEVVCVGDGMAKVIEQHYSGKVNVVTNGFDPSDDVRGIKASEKFSIMHIGSLGRKRNPLVVWKALAALIGEGHRLKDHLEIKLIGDVDLSAKQSLQELGLMPYANLPGYVSHEEAILEQRKAWCLLLPVDRYEGATFTLPGKLFEYLMARRTIFALAPKDGESAGIVRECKAGYVLDYDDIEESKRAIEELFQKYETGNAQVDSEGIDKYSRRSATGRMAQILDSLLD